MMVHDNETLTNALEIIKLSDDRNFEEEGFGASKSHVLLNIYDMQTSLSKSYELQNI